MLKVQRRREAFGQYLARLRYLLDISQRELAKKARLSQSQLSRIEAGIHSPKEATVIRLADALRLIGDRRRDFMARAGYSPPPGKFESEYYETLRDLDIVVDVYEDANRLFHEKSDYEAAKMRFVRLAEALSEFKDTERLRLRGLAYFGLAGVQHIHNEATESLFSLHEAERIGKSIGDSNLARDAAKAIGVTMNNIGRAPLAVDHYRRVLQGVEPKPDNDYFLGTTQRDLMVALAAIGDFREIDNLARTSLEALGRIGYDRGIVLVKETWGRALIRQGKFNEAEDILWRALAESTITPLTALETMIVNLTLLELFLARGDDNLGLYLAEVAREWGQKHGLEHQLQHRLAKLVNEYLGISRRDFLSH